MPLSQGKPLADTALIRAEARISMAAITANCEFLRSKLTGGAELCAVVKADGYGHGIEQTARAAVAGGATRLAVVTAEEAAEVARLRLGVPLILVGPPPLDELPAAVETGAQLTAWSADQIHEIRAAAILLDRKVDVHVKLDTGMSRFGAKTADEALAALDAAAESESIDPVGVWTHFATADEADDEFFGRQLARFSEFAAEAKRRHPTLLAHAANSAATLRDAASHFDFVRCGIAVYGLDPFQGDAAATGLTPALSLHSYVASVRPLAAGESVGYGRRFVAERDTLVATVPIGYGDGWRRALSDNSDVLIGGRRFRQRGTISMDSIGVDLDGETDVLPGAPVTLIGADGEQRITTEDVAARIGTINYEVTCGLTARTVRSYDRG